MSEKEQKPKYYTKEFPSGPWSRACERMRTGNVAGKPFDEEAYREGQSDGILSPQKKESNPTKSCPECQ